MAHAVYIRSGTNISSSDLALWVKSFGAEVAVDVNRHTTHVIANPDRKTTKVKKATRYPRVKIVNAEWMLQCCTQWQHVDETPYLIEIDAADREGSPHGDSDGSDGEATGEEGVTVQVDDLVQLDMSAEKWQSLEDEFQDFMNESDDSDDNSNSDTESVRSDTSAAMDSRSNKRKRKRKAAAAEESGADDSDASVGSTDSVSRTQRRKKRNVENSSSLTTVVTAERSSGLPSPETTGPEEDQAEEEGEEEGENVVKPTGLDIGEEDYDDGLEAEMLADRKSVV